VTVGNLPTGLKFTAKPVTAKVREGTKTVTVTNVSANTIYGVPTSVQTKAAKVTVTTSGKSKRVYELKITVDPLPAYAQGSFDGPVNLEDGTTNGVATLTVAANGKVSGSVQQIENGKNVKYTLTATSLSDYDLKSGDFTLRPTYKAGSVTKTIELRLAANEADKRLGIVAGGSDDFTLALYQNVWKNSATKGDPEVAPEIVTRKWTEDSLTLTLKKGGVLSIAGKLTNAADGSQVSVSGTSQVFYVPEEDVYKAVIYLAPKTKFAGLAEIIEIGE